MSVKAYARDTWACVGTGPSLTDDDVQSLMGRVRVIAINDAVRLCPWADVLYACDGKWINQYQGVPSFPREKYSMTVNSRRYPAWVKLRNAGPVGLSRDPSSLCTGSNSGYQAINLAVHLGAARILLLGYDMQRHSGKSHFFGEHPQGWLPSPYKKFLQAFPSLVAPLAAAGVEVINCSRVTALTTFPRQDLATALEHDLRVAV